MVTPRVITANTHAASSKAFNELHAAKTLPALCERRQGNALNNLIEQNHCSHQTPCQAWDGLFFFGNGMAHLSGIGRNAYDLEKDTCEK